MNKELDDIKELRCLVYSCQENYIDNAEKVFLPILDRLEKSLKALEIITNKRVDVGSFINYFIEHNNSYETYFLYFERPIEIDYVVISEELLSHEEFDLLKEVLLNE